MNPFPDHYRLKPTHTIREGDMELVQEIELLVTENMDEVKALGRLMLRDGKGWHLKPVTRGYVGMKVEDTGTGCRMHKDVWRPRKKKMP